MTHKRESYWNWFYSWFFYSTSGDNLDLGESHSALDQLTGSREKVETLDQANTEIERLRKANEKLSGELQGS